MKLIPYSVKTNRFRVIYPLKDLIIKTIDEDQKIKRLMTYPTKTPFENQGVTYDGKLIEQLDINDSLLENFELPLVDNISGREFLLKNEECLFSYSWQDRQTTVDYPTIYVSHVRTTDDIVNKIIFDLAIIVPSEYEPLIEGRRSTELLIAISDVLDRATTDKEASKLVGNLELQVGNVYESKLVKSVKSTLITTTISATSINKNRLESNVYERTTIL